MNKKQLFLSDVLSYGLKITVNNIWYMIWVTIVYVIFLIMGFIIPVLAFALLHVSFFSMRSVAQKFIGICSDSTILATDKITQLMGVFEAIGSAAGIFWLVLGSIIIFLLIFYCIMLCCGFLLGYRKIMLNLYDRKPAPLSLLLTSVRYVLRYLVACCLFSLMIIVPTIIIGIVLNNFEISFLISRVIIGTVFGFFDWFIIDKNDGAIASLRNSYYMAKDYVWKLFLLNVGFGCFLWILGCMESFGYVPSLALSLLNFFIGLLWMFCYIYMYRALSGTEGECVQQSPVDRL